MFERPEEGAPDLIDAGDAYPVSRDMERTSTQAAIPSRHTVPHTLCSTNNLMSTFIMIEAAVRLGEPVERLRRREERVAGPGLTGGRAGSSRALVP